MNKILQNIKETVIKKLDSEKIPNLSSAKIEKCSYNKNKYNFYAHYYIGNDINTAVRISFYLKKVTKVLNPIKMIKEKRFTKKYYYGSLSLDSGKDKRVYVIDSNEYRILPEIYNGFINYLGDTEKSNLKNIYEMTKTDVSLVRNENIPHNF